MDRYDLAIKRLTEKPELIDKEWGNAIDLFKFCAPNNEATTPEGNITGCLTMIRETRDHGEFHAWTPELTAAILADDRLPNHASKITVESLPVFAEWQRRLDAEFKEIANAG